MFVGFMIRALSTCLLVSLSWRCLHVSWFHDQGVAYMFVGFMIRALSTCLLVS